MRLKHKVAVVTGAASGIGRAIALRFAEEGARVVINDISESVRDVADLIHETGGSAVIHIGDIRLKSTAVDLMHAANKSFGELHILVNNAGTSGGTSVVAAEEEDWDRMMNLNLKSAWYCCKYAIPMMISQGGGSIVNISSTHAFRTQPNHFPYQITKAGMLAMSNGICVDFGSQGIRVNSICPGFIETPLAEKHMRQFPNREEKTRRMLDSHPLGRFGKPEDVAYAASFLASDEAAFISGTTLVVDGGRSALQKSD